MKPPYFIVTAKCRNDRCQTEEFKKERKKIVKIGTSGQPYTIDALVCPGCGSWAKITDIEEMKG